MEHTLTKYEILKITGRGDVIAFEPKENNLGDTNIHKNDTVILNDGTKWLIYGIEGFSGGSELNTQIGLIVKPIDVNKNAAFIAAKQAKYPNLDIEKINRLFDEEIKRLKDSMPKQFPDHIHELRLPLDCDLNKNIFIVVLENYNK